MAFKDQLILNIKNIPGPFIKKKIVIIECDDWGGIRMPSKKVFDKLLNHKIPVDRNRYNMYDTLANTEDLEMLFDVLLSQHDSRGNHAVITPVINVANPDFKKIKEFEFEKYFYEPFTSTLKRYYANESVFEKWKEGINKGIFLPEIHGREHISVHHWLNHLRRGNKNLLYAFEHEFVSVPIPGIHQALIEFRPEFYFDDINQIDFLKKSILDGIHLFNDIFNYIPIVFVPSNGIFHPLFENDVANSGIRYLYVSHFNPTPKDGNLKLKYYHIGKKSQVGITYYTRNCVFEPTDINYLGISHTLNQIEAAFRWGKAANISTHRVNFIGSIEPRNREKGLKELKKLLVSITSKWPDVIFMSTGEYVKMVENSKK